jgi:hypothetical protein
VFGASAVALLLGLGLAGLWGILAVRSACRLLREADELRRVGRLKLREVTGPVTAVVAVVPPPQRTQRSPGSGREAVWWSVRHEAAPRGERHGWVAAGAQESETPFRVADGAACGWVIPLGASFDLPEHVHDTSWRDERGKPVLERFIERRIEPGQLIFLVGPAWRQRPPAWTDGSPDPDGALDQVPVFGSTDTEVLRVRATNPTREAGRVRRRAWAGLLLASICILWVAAVAIAELRFLVVRCLP